MCWRDQYRPLSSIDIKWNLRVSSAKSVKIGDRFTFGPDRFSEGLRFNRILKPGDDEIMSDRPEFKDKTRIKFTKGNFSSRQATINLSRCYHCIRIHLDTGLWFYPFQKRRNAPRPETLEFEVISIPT